ncbi:MAG: HEAT repeat domain-containing protein, partial [Planctomycetota bacterium]|nr:HEAT repeat domain-containing protein [Planctomycetota bacterium]
MILRTFALVSALIATPGLAATQEGTAGRPARPQDVEKIDTFIRHARTGSAVIRPQAAERLVRIGAPAAARLYELSGDSTEELALMGTALVEVLGQFDHPELRAKLWPALEDADFPWRPAAARSLAWAPTVDEWERLEGYLDDPIAPVRLAVLDGLFRISQFEGEEPEAKALQARRKRVFLDHAVSALHDENDMV